MGEYESKVLAHEKIRGNDMERRETGNSFGSPMRRMLSGARKGFFPGPG